MTEVAGTVVEVRDGRAIVECRAEPGGCSLCAGGRGCSWRRMVGTQSLAVPALNDATLLAPGDTVTIAIDETQLLAAAARLYLPPLAGLLLGPGLAWAAGAEEWLGLPAAVLGLAAGWTFARRWARRTPTLTVRRQWQETA